MARCVSRRMEPDARRTLWWKILSRQSRSTLSSATRTADVTRESPFQTHRVIDALKDSNNQQLVLISKIKNFPFPTLPYQRQGSQSMYCALLLGNSAQTNSVRISCLDATNVVVHSMPAGIPTLLLRVLPFPPKLVPFPRRLHALPPRVRARL